MYIIYNIYSIYHVYHLYHQYHISFAQIKGLYCKTLPFDLPEADCSIYTLSVVGWSSSRFVTINSTSIKPSIKVRNLTYYIFGESL